MNIKKITPEYVKKVGDYFGVDWNKIDLDEAMMGILVELEHGSKDPQTNVTDNNSVSTLKIAVAHLKEIPDYYTRLKKMEKEGKDFWKK